MLKQPKIDPKHTKNIFLEKKTFPEDCILDVNQVKNHLKFRKLKKLKTKEIKRKILNLIQKNQKQIVKESKLDWRIAATKLLRLVKEKLTPKKTKPNRKRRKLEKKPTNPCKKL